MLVVVLATGIGVRVVNVVTGVVLVPLAVAMVVYAATLAVGPVVVARCEGTTTRQVWAGAWAGQKAVVRRGWARLVHPLDTCRRCLVALRRALWRSR